MADTKDVILNIKTNFAENIDQLAKLQKELDDLKVAELQLNAAVKSGTKTREEADKELEALAAQVRNVKNEQREYRKEIDNEIKKQQEAEGSIRQLRAELKNMVKEYDNLSAADRNSDAGTKLRDNIKGLTDQLKQLEGETGRFQRNVGDYRNAIQEAINGTIPLKTVLKELKGDIQTLSFQFRQYGDEIQNKKTVLDQIAATVGKDTDEYRQQAQALADLEQKYNETGDAINNMQLAAGQISDTIADTNTAIANFGKDNASLKAAAEGMGLLANSYSVVQAGMAAVGAESEDLVKIWAKMQVVQQGINALNQIAAALEKESVLRQQLRIVTNKLLGKTMTQTAAAKQADAAASVTAAAADTTLAAGETAATAAAGGLTVALKGVGAAIKKIPVIGWILAAVSALGTLTALAVRHLRTEREENKLLTDRKKLQKEINALNAEGEKNAQKAIIELKTQIEYVNSLEQGSKEWNTAVQTVADTLGVTRSELGKNLEKLDEYAEAWIKLQILQAKSDVITTKIAENEAKLINARTDIEELLSSTKEKDRTEELQKQYGFSKKIAEQITIAYKAYEKSEDNSFFKYLFNFSENNGSKDLVNFLNSVNDGVESIKITNESYKDVLAEILKEAGTLSGLFSGGSTSTYTDRTKDYINKIKDLYISALDDMEARQYAMTKASGEREIEELKQRAATAQMTVRERELLNRQIVLMEADLQIKLGTIRDEYANKRKDEENKNAKAIYNEYIKYLDELKDGDLWLSIKLRINDEDTKLQLSEIDRQIAAAEKSLQNYQNDLKRIRDEKNPATDEEIYTKYSAVFELYGVVLDESITDWHDRIVKAMATLNNKVLDEFVKNTNQLKNYRSIVKANSKKEERRIQDEHLKKVHDNQLDEINLARKHAEILRAIELESNYDAYSQNEVEKTRILLEQAKERQRIANEEYAYISAERKKYTDQELIAIYGSLDAYNNAVLEANLKVIESENDVKDAMRDVANASTQQKITMIENATSIMGSVNNILGSMQGLFETMAESNESYADFATAMALMQILVSTAISIANAIEGATAAGAATGAAAPFTTPVFITEMVAIVAGALASATTTLLKAQQAKKSAPKFAEGGLIGGHYATSQAEGTRDDVAIQASKGEYIINANAVKRYGVGFLDSINGTSGSVSITKFANGGYVSDATVMAGNYQFQMDMTRQMMVEAISEIQPVVSVVEVTKAQNRVAMAERISKK